MTVKITKDEITVHYGGQFIMMLKHEYTPDEAVRFVRANHAIRNGKTEIYLYDRKVCEITQYGD
jgi:hypothetical protein